VKHDNEKLWLNTVAAKPYFKLDSTVFKYRHDHISVMITVYKFTVYAHPVRLIMHPSDIISQLFIMLNLSHVTGGASCS